MDQGEFSDEDEEVTKELELRNQIRIKDSTFIVLHFFAISN